MIIFRYLFNSDYEWTLWKREPLSLINYRNFSQSEARQFYLLQYRKLSHVVDTASQNGASYNTTRSRLCARLRDKSLIIAHVGQPLSIAPITGLALPAKTTCALEGSIAGKTILLGRQNARTGDRRKTLSLHLKFSTIVFQGILTPIYIWRKFHKIYFICHVKKKYSNFKHRQ